MFNLGDNVKVNNSSKIGKIIKVLDNNKYLVLLNDKNLIVNNHMLTPCNSQSNNICQVKINIENKDKLKTFTPEIMLRHQVLEEALFNLEQFIDDAFNNNVQTVRIIHGKNGGILRKAVHEFLKSNNKILSFRLGNYFEGSYGVTIATLKNKIV